LTSVDPALRDRFHTALSQPFIKFPMALSELPSGYSRADDRGFSARVVMAMVVYSIPMWIGVPMTLFLNSRLWGVAVIAVWLPIELTILHFKFRFTNCPKCGERIRVPWSSAEYLRGGMLRYNCDRCRIVWATHLYPGSD
jgi:hypothetical protein